MGLAAGLAEAAGGEVAGVIGKGDADAEGEGRGAGGAGVTLGLREKAIGDAVAAKVRTHGNPSEVEGVALPRGKETADEPPVGFGDDDCVALEGSGNGLCRLRERARFRRELAAVFLEGAADQCRDLDTLRRRRETDRDIGRAGAQMPPVCSGR